MVDVWLEHNIGTEEAPTWALITGGDELTWTTAQLTSGTPYDQVPYITKPSSGATIVERLWVWDTSASVFSRTETYDGTVNTNVNVLRWNWDGALNSPPIFTSYFDLTHATATRGDNSVLGGTVSTDSFSHLKACISSSGLGANWCTETTGTLGAVTDTNVGQSLNGDIGSDAQYLQLSYTPTAAGSATLNVIMYVSAEEDTGTHTPYFSCKYTYV